MPRGWRRRLAIAAGIALALRAILPWALEAIAERQGTAALGVPLRVGDVDLHLYRGGLAIEDLRIGNRAQPADAAEIDPSTTLLSLQRAWVRIAWLDLLRGRLRLRELEIDAPRVRVEREADGRIVPLPERAEEPAEPASHEDGSGAPPRLVIDRFALRAAHLGLSAAGQPERELLGFGLDELTLADVALDEQGVSLGAIGIRRPSLRVRRELALGEDVPAAPPAPEPPPVGAAPAGAPAAARPPLRARHIQIERAAFTLQMPDSDLDVVLHLEADGATAVRGETFPARLALEVAQGTLEAEGTVGIDPPLYDGVLRWRGIAVRPLLEPLPGNRIESLDSATASGDLKLAIALAPADGSAPELRVSGALGLTDVKGRPPGQDMTLAWKSLDVEIDELRLPLEGTAPPRVALRRIRLVEPAARVVLAAPPEGSAAGGAAEEPGATASVDSGPPAPSPQLSLGSLEVSGGRVELVDRSVSPEYRGQLRRLGLAARDLRWPQGDVRDLRLAFTGPAEAALDLRGGLRARKGDLTLKLEKLALAGFNPYAQSLAGLEVARGSFSLATTARAQGERWDVSNDLRIHDLSLASGGSRVVPGVGLPISAVLALLRDPAGDIRLGVPLQVDAEGARAGLGKIIAGALRQTLVGLVSSPLKVLGIGAGGDADAQPASLACTPGSADLVEAEQEHVSAIAALLAERPALGLVLRGRAGGADSLAVAEQVLREALEAGNAPDLADSGFLQRRRLRGALEARARGAPDELDAEDRAALERWIAATPVPPERLQALAALRGELLLENLATLYGVPRARLSLADPLEGDPAVALEIGAVDVPES
jgi:hypothetical protein